MPAVVPSPLPPPPDTRRRDWTIAEVRALIAANPLQSPRYELVDGELLVTPSPSESHQLAVTQVVLALGPYVAAQGLGRVLTSPSDIELERGRLVQPDVYVLSMDARRHRVAPRSAGDLLLAVEIVSPSSARYDRLVKRRLHQQAGVPEYWVVDLEARLVERWRPGEDRPEVLDETLHWELAGAAAPLAIELPRFFAEVFDEGSPGAERP